MKRRFKLLFIKNFAISIRLFFKSLVIGAGLTAGFLSVSLLAIAVNNVSVKTDWTSGSSLTSTELNNIGSGIQAIKTALEGIPNWTKGTTTTDAVFNDGNVGIGTASPGYKLVIDANVKGHGGIQIENSNTEIESQSSLNFATRPTGGVPISENGKYGWHFSARGFNSQFTTEKEDFIFAFHADTTWTNVLFMEHDTGNVGIGTTTPTAKLEVNGSLKLAYSGSAVITIAPDSFNTITHNRNINCPLLQMIFATNGHPSANPFNIVGSESIDTNSFKTNISGGTSGTGRINWFILCF